GHGLPVTTEAGHRARIDRQRIVLRTDGGEVDVIGAVAARTGRGCIGESDAGRHGGCGLVVAFADRVQVEGPVDVVLGPGFSAVGGDAGPDIGLSWLLRGRVAKVV